MAILFMDLTNIEGIERLECITLYIHFMTQLCTVKNIGNVTVKNYLNERLLSLLCFIIYGQGSFEKGLM